MTQVKPPNEATNNFRPVGPVVPAEDTSLWFDSKSYFDKAVQTLEQAKAQAVDTINANKTRGYEEGWQAGVNEAAALLAKTQVSVNNFYARLDTEITEIIISVVKEILDDYEPTETVVQIVRKAIKTLNLGTELTLSVSPELADSVQKRLKDLLPDGQSSLVISIRSKPDLQGSAAILSSDFGSVDLSIDKQLETLGQTLRAVGTGLK